MYRNLVTVDVRELAYGDDWQVVEQAVMVAECQGSWTNPQGKDQGRRGNMNDERMKTVHLA